MPGEHLYKRIGTAPAASSHQSDSFTPLTSGGAHNKRMGQGQHTGTINQIVYHHGGGASGGENKQAYGGQKFLGYPMGVKQSTTQHFKKFTNQIYHPQPKNLPHQAVK